MTTDPTEHDLGHAVRAFQTAEAALARLSEQAETVAGAGEQVEAARAVLGEVHEAYAESLQQHAELIRALTQLSENLVAATEVVRRNDPAKVFDAIDRLTVDFERQKERVSEMTGELRARLDESTRTIESVITDQIDALDKVNEQRAQNLGQQLQRPAVAAAVLAAAAAGLQIVALVTR